ncbi:transposase [Azospirillum sp. sgz301742]
MAANASPARQSVEGVFAVELPRGARLVGPPVVQEDGSYAIPAVMELQELFCPCCRSRMVSHGYGDPRKVTLCPINCRPAVLHLKPQRYICPACRDNPDAKTKTVTPAPPWIAANHRMSLVTLDNIGKQALARPAAEVGRAFGVSEATVRVLRDERVADLRRSHTLPVPDILGVDGFQSGKMRMTNLTDIVARRPFDLWPVGEKDKDAVAALTQYFRALDGLESVSFVMMDMSDVLRSAVRNVKPRQEIIACGLHVVKMILKSQWEAAKKFASGVKISVDARRVLISSLLNKYTLTDTEQEALDRYLATNRPLQQAYHHGLEFRGIVRCESCRQAEARYAQWFQKDLPQAVSTCFSNVRQKWPSWRKEILTIADVSSARTNNYTENRNQRVEAIHQACPGIGFDALRNRYLFSSSIFQDG